MPAKLFHDGDAVKIGWYRKLGSTGSHCHHLGGNLGEKSSPNHRGTARGHPASTDASEKGSTAPQGQEKGKGL